jgi:hypothetical protein
MPALSQAAIGKGRKNYAAWKIRMDRKKKVVAPAVPRIA